MTRYWRIQWLEHKQVDSYASFRNVAFTSKSLLQPISTRPKLLPLFSFSTDTLPEKLSKWVLTTCHRLDLKNQIRPPEQNGGCNEAASWRRETEWMELLRMSRVVYYFFSVTMSYLRLNAYIGETGWAWWGLSLFLETVRKIRFIRVCSLYHHNCKRDAQYESTRTFAMEYRACLLPNLVTWPGSCSFTPLARIICFGESLPKCTYQVITWWINAKMHLTSHYLVEPRGFKQPILS